MFRLQALGFGVQGLRFGLMVQGLQVYIMVQGWVTRGCTTALVHKGFYYRVL